eukprot:TRINITY_DN11648_c0_g1_i1.p1 TRINITY_DN11648_c0_g1~~TRINITY_DN11648_c0_g1_i1.p1  ORF type:complete len:462 (-),score=92.12 TRINITY_DN11648_c0_g1_i1:40-1425(-)
MTPRVLVALTILLRCADLCHGKLLLFVAVDSSTQTQQLLQKNVAHVKEQHIDCDVVLGLYKGDVSDLDPEWYKREVSHAVVGRGYKFHLMQTAYHDMREKSPWEKTYEFVWALDSDIDITQSDVPQLLALARVTGSPIVGPTFVSSGSMLAAMTVTGQGHLLRKHGLSPRVHHKPQHSDRGPNPIQNPNASCDYRHTDFVELTAPLLSPKVLDPLLEDCHDCIQKRSDWGLDMMWCNYMSQKFDVKGCALIDKVPVVHLDWGLAHVNRNFYDALHRVEASYKQYWSKHMTLSCELEADAHKVANIREQHRKGKHGKTRRSKVFQRTHKKKSNVGSVPARHGDHQKKYSAAHKDEHEAHKHKKNHQQALPGESNAEQDNFDKDSIEAMLNSEGADSEDYAEGYPWEDPVIREGRLIGSDDRMEKIWIVTDKASSVDEEPPPTVEPDASSVDEEPPPTVEPDV